MKHPKEHYDHHLGYFYSWMVGDFDEKQKEQEDYFLQNAIRPAQNKVAVDLGAGHGLQTVSLLKIGFEVIAIDFNRQLLEELEERSKGQQVKLILGDIKDPSLYRSYSPELVVCMGDTITHLHTVDEVKELTGNVFEALLPEGKFIISYRDFSRELQSGDRFIPVRSDENRIHTCFLEYFADHVAVTDILHERERGHWTQKISSFRKLRIPEKDLKEIFEGAGFKIVHTMNLHGMNYLIGQKQ